MFIADAILRAVGDDLGSTKQRVGGQKIVIKSTRNIVFVELKNPQFLQVLRESWRKMSPHGSTISNRRKDNEKSSDSEYNLLRVQSELILLFCTKFGRLYICLCPLKAHFRLDIVAW